MIAHDTVHTVWGYDCGYGGPFKPLSLANYFQEAAGDHAKKLGIGMDDMFSRGLTWMLSRIDIEVESLPSKGDTVTVRTWPSGTSKVFARRYMELIDGTGKLMAGALYEYLIVDLNSRHIVRPEKFVSEAMRGGLPAPYPDLNPGLSEVAGFPGGSRRGQDADAGARAAKGDRGRTEVLTAAPRHIDYNGHVNNAYFVEWLCDAVPSPMRGRGSATRIKVDFVVEARAGDLLTAGWFTLPEEWPKGVFSYVSKEDQLLARAYTEWGP